MSIFQILKPGVSSISESNVWCFFSSRFLSSTVRVTCVRATFSLLALLGALAGPALLLSFQVESLIGCFYLEKSDWMFLTCSWPDTCIRAGRRISHHWTLVWGRGIHHNHYTTPRHRSVYRATIIIIGITSIIAITFAASKIPTSTMLIQVAVNIICPLLVLTIFGTVNYCKVGFCKCQLLSTFPITSSIYGSRIWIHVPGFPYKQTPSEPPGDLQDCG